MIDCLHSRRNQTPGKHKNLVHPGTSQASIGDGPDDVHSIARAMSATILAQLGSEKPDAGLIIGGQTVATHGREQQLVS